MKDTEKINKALQIAIRDLRSCYEGNGIVAGRHHFTDYWGRDAFFAALGSFAIGDYEIVKKLLELFFSYQRKDGLIPYRIMRGPMSIRKYFGKETKLFKNLRPTYRLRWIGPVIMDTTILCVTLCAMLSMTNKDTGQFEKEVINALKFLEKRERFGLLWEGVMTEWNDTAWKHGNLLYTSILYWKMYDELVKSHKQFKKLNLEALKMKRDTIAGAMRKRLWNGEYFMDWRGYKKHNYFYSYGNLLTVAWGLANDKETESILNKAKDSIYSFTVESNVPKYPWWRIDLTNHLTGTADYQNMGLLWISPAALYVLALSATGKPNEGNAFINNLCDKVIKDGTVYEVYERNGIPMHRWFLKSENPFAWSSGLLTLSLTQYLNRRRKVD